MKKTLKENMKENVKEAIKEAMKEDMNMEKKKVKNNSGYQTTRKCMENSTFKA